MPSRERSSYFSSILKETAQSLSRNTLISIAAVISIIAALIILGLFIIFTANVNKMTNAAESNSEIKIFLRDAISDEQRTNFYQILEDDDRISEITYESKEEALENFTEHLNEYSGLLSNYSGENNPLPESYIVKAYNIEDLAQIKELAEQYPDVVEYVRYRENFIDSLTNFSNFVNYLSLGLLIIMSVIALYLIYNTIRLTVSNRSKEIEIMKSVGATNEFIQIPFILEGTFIGLVASILSLLLICLVYYYGIGFLSGSLFFTVEEVIVTPGNLVLLLLISFVLYGGIIGSAGAAFATHKYLDV